MLLRSNLRYAFQFHEGSCSLLQQKHFTHVFDITLVVGRGLSRCAGRGAI